ncbi:MAG: DUF1127 domain-containing protein [Hyphomicrobiales bacterium]
MEFYQFHSDLWRSRRRLEELSEKELRDIGITREDALQEARKGFWVY